MNFLDEIFRDSKAEPSAAYSSENKKDILEKMLLYAKNLNDEELVSLIKSKLEPFSEGEQKPALNPFDVLLSKSMEAPKDSEKTLVTKEDANVKQDAEVLKEESPFSFGKNSVSGKPNERALLNEDKTEVKEEKQRGTVTPFGDRFINTFKMRIKDCVFSMFMGEIGHEHSPYTEDIYFMVAPFEVNEDAISAEILLYIFYNGMGYIYSSIGNKENKSCYVEIPKDGGNFSFIARGKWEKGKWSSSVSLGISSARNNDVFRIKNVFHNSPEKVPENPHPRFHYEGYINRDDLASVGSVDVFPVDGSGESFVAVRCIEDFVDYIDLSLTPECEIKKPEGREVMTVSFKDGEINLDFTKKKEVIREWI